MKTQSDVKVSKVQRVLTIKGLLTTVGWADCPGQAHDPKLGIGMDHCPICAPWWGKIPFCQDCGSRPVMTNKEVETAPRVFEKLMYCEKCRKYMFIWEAK